jgi:DNA mismatch endonuclease (patch repair protein)
MSRVRNKDTKPEILVRSLLHRNGFRFRLHKKGLPGKPDIVLPKYNVVILVHGCFWHRHNGCADATTPKTRTSFWESKFNENVQRDTCTVQALRDAGWKVIIVWECETTRPERLIQRLLSEIKRTSNKTIDSDKK